MAQLRGSAVEAILGFETAYGTPDINGFKIPFLAGLNASSSKAINNNETITGNPNPQKGFLGFENGTFSGTFPVDDKALPILLKGLMGTPTTTDNLDGTYTHVYKIQQDVPSMFLELNHSDNVSGLFYMVRGIGLNTMSITFGGDDQLIVTVEGVCKTADDPTTTSAVTGTVTDLTDGTGFQKFQSNVTSDMGAGVKFSDLTIDYSNTISADDSRYMDGTGQINGVPAGVRSVSGTISVLFEDDTVFNIARNFTDATLKNTLTNGLAAPALRTLEFDMPEVNLEALSNGSVSSTTGLIIDALPYSAFYQDNANATALQVSLTNQTASYA